MWNLFGDKNSIQLMVTESGYQKIIGTTLSHKVFTHTYYNPTGETGEKEDKTKAWFDEQAQLVENINQLEFSWSIKPSNAKVDISWLDGEKPHG